jgi:hypothetical protein
MVGNDFNLASVIWCHDSIDAVAYVRSSRLYDKSVKCTKNDPPKLLASDGYPRYVEDHPLVFGTVTKDSEYCWYFTSY